MSRYKTPESIKPHYFQKLQYGAEYLAWRDANTINGYVPLTYKEFALIVEQGIPVPTVDELRAMPEFERNALRGWK